MKARDVGDTAGMRGVVVVDMNTQCTKEEPAGGILFVFPMWYIRLDRKRRLADVVETPPSVEPLVASRLLAAAYQQFVHAPPARQESAGFLPPVDPASRMRLRCRGK